MLVALKQILAVSRVPCHHQYLGLPTFIPRNRAMSFHFLKDKLWRKLQGWKGKFFSSGGKEVLIKSIAQALPCYTMNCFHIPSQLIQELHQIVARFWWHGSSNERSIHWLVGEHCVARSVWDVLVSGSRAF